MGQATEMLTKIQQYIDSGNKQITIMSNGGNTQVSLKVEIDSFDNVGMVFPVSTNGTDLML